MITGAACAYVVMVSLIYKDWRAFTLKKRTVRRPQKNNLISLCARIFLGLSTPLGEKMLGENTQVTHGIYCKESCQELNATHLLAPTLKGRRWNNTRQNQSMGKTERREAARIQSPWTSYLERNSYWPWMPLLRWSLSDRDLPQESIIRISTTGERGRRRRKIQ